MKVSQLASYFQISLLAVLRLLAFAPAFPVVLSLSFFSKWLEPSSCVLPCTSTACLGHKVRVPFVSFLTSNMFNFHFARPGILYPWGASGRPDPILLPGLFFFGLLALPVSWALLFVDLQIRSSGLLPLFFFFSFLPTFYHFFLLLCEMGPMSFPSLWAFFVTKLF